MGKRVVQVGNCMRANGVVRRFCPRFQPARERTKPCLSEFRRSSAYVLQAQVRPKISPSLLLSVRMSCAVASAASRLKLGLDGVASCAPAISYTA